jgi:hypothetical protein
MGILSSLGGIFGGQAGRNFGKMMEGNTSPAPSGPQPVDYSKAMEVMSDNNKMTALEQINAQRFAIVQTGVDRELQLAAQLELGIEKLDTNLQVSKLEYLQRMAAEENRHVEKMSRSGGIPEPEFPVSTEPMRRIP